MTRPAAPRTLVLEGGFDPAALSDLPGLQTMASEGAEEGGVRVTAALCPGAPAQETLKAAFSR